MNVIPLPLAQNNIGRLDMSLKPINQILLETVYNCFNKMLEKLQ